MWVWRLTRRRHANTAFEGIGSERVGGRWSPRGIRVVYTSESISLCVLETLVHLEVRHMSSSHVVIGADIPDDLPREEILLPDLPLDWQRHPAPAELQRLGRDWVVNGATTILRAPSAIVPDEYNYLINPLHSDFGRIRVGQPQPFSFDGRLWKGIYGLSQ